MCGSILKHRAFPAARAASSTLVSLLTAALVIGTCGCHAESPSQSARLTLWLDRSTAIECVRIAPGRFLMGAADSDDLALAEEKPQHEATIARAFYLARTPVTMGQFRIFVAETGYRTNAETDTRPRYMGGHGYNPSRNRFEGWFPQYTWRYTGFPLTDQHPVCNVSWNDAMAFCAWLSRKTGRCVRLPKETEWEYACRAGTRTRYFTGEAPDSLRGYANVADQSMREKLAEPPDPDRWFSFNDGFPFTAPVARFKPNPWGLYDMVGNVWQWCGDRTVANYAASDAAGTGDASHPQEDRRVVRGGSYNDGPQLTRSAARGFGKTYSRYAYFGFRVAVSPQ